MVFRVAVLVPILLGLMLCGCSGKVNEADLVGQWEGYVDMSQFEAEFGDMGDTGDIPLAALELKADGSYEMYSLAGTWFGDWSVGGGTLKLNMTGMDDGYRDSRESGDGPSSWGSQELKIRSKDEFVWHVPGTKDMSEEVVFERRRE